MPTITEVYETTEAATPADALGEAATALRKAFQERANKHGNDDAEAQRLMAAHKRLIQMRTDYDRDTD